MQQPLPSLPLTPLPRRAYVIFGVTALTLMMMAINGFIVSVAFPTIRQDFASNLALVGWVFTGFFLANTVVMPLAGKLSDGFGRKRVYLLSIVVFTLSSLGCGLAPNVYVLIACRVVQGIATGAIQLSATGVISDAFGARRQTALGLFSSIYPIGAILGPNLGGVIIEQLSWRWIFFVNIPIGVAVLVLGSFLFPSSAQQKAGKVDAIGAATFGGAVLLFLLALTDLANNIEAWQTPVFWGYLAVAGALLALFVREERRVPDPIIDLKLLADRAFLSLNLYGFIYGVGIFAVIAFLPINAQLSYGMSPAASGFVLTPRAICMIAASTLSAFLLARTGYRLPLIGGVVLGSIATLLLGLGIHEPSLLGITLSDMVFVSAVMGLSGLGNGMVLPSMTNAGLDLVPGKVASITGIISLFNNTGNIVGTAVIILVMSQFQDPGMGLRVMLLAMAGLIVLSIPFTFLFPDLGRRRRQRASLPAAQQPAPTEAPR